jgi:hypothetical protein
MGTLYDQAVAQAETELRRRLDEYRFSKQKDDATVATMEGIGREPNELRKAELSKVIAGDLHGSAWT